MKHFLSVSVCLLLLSTLAAAQATKSTAKDATLKVIGMLMYADWCESCKVLEPKINEVKKEFDGQGILFTRFDMTDEFTKNQSSLYASWVGLEEILKQNEGRTGYMLLVEATSHKILEKLVKTQTPDEIRAAIQTVLKQK